MDAIRTIERTPPLMRQLLDAVIRYRRVEVKTREIIEQCERGDDDTTVRATDA